MTTRSLFATQLRTASAALILASATSGAARQTLISVPFVGCPSDGQLGPQPGPKSGKTPRLPPDAAKILAWYGDSEKMGVLAPRGWHCIALYGSNGSFLVVTPERHLGDEFSRERPISIRGPAVQLSYSFAGTSGRDEVMPVIARYFPAYRPFIGKMKKLDLVFGTLPTGPYQTDTIVTRTSNFVRFITPAGKTGEGTHSWLSAGDLPIEGVRKVVGTPDEPDLIGAEVRLPRSLSRLTEVILSRVK